jgi:hypothetical protein
MDRLPHALLPDAASVQAVDPKLQQYACQINNIALLRHVNRCDYIMLLIF